MCATRSRLSSAGGSCGRQTAGHSSCRAQGPRSVGGTLPWLARPLGTASPSTCGLHRCPEIHLRKNSLTYLAASALEVFSNWALYKFTYSFIHSFIHSFMLLNKPCLTQTLRFHKLFYNKTKIRTFCSVDPDCSKSQIPVGNGDERTTCRNTDQLQY